LASQNPNWVREPVATFKKLATLLGIPMYPRSDGFGSTKSSSYKKEFNIQRRRWLRSFQNRVGEEHPRILYDRAYLEKIDDATDDDGADGADGVEMMETLDGAGEGTGRLSRLLFEVLLSDYFHADRDTLRDGSYGAPPGAQRQVARLQQPSPQLRMASTAEWPLPPLPQQQVEQPAPTYPVANAEGRFMELAPNQYFNNDQGGSGDCLYRNLAFLARYKYGLQVDSSSLRSLCNTWLSVDLDRESQNPEMVARVALASTLRENVTSELFNMEESPNAAPGFLRETVSRLMATHGSENLKVMVEDELMKAFAVAHSDESDWGELPNIMAAAWVLKAEVYVYKQSARHAQDHLAFADRAGPTDSNRKFFLYNVQGRHFAAIVPRREDDDAGMEAVAMEIDTDSSIAFDKIDILETYQSKRKRQRR